jgi:hypothetical protein
MAERPPMTLRSGWVAAATMICIGLLVGGCGGGGSEQSSNSSGPAPKAPTAQPTTQPRSSRPAPPHRRPPHRPRATARSKNPTSVQNAVAQAIQRLPESQRARIVEQTAGITFKVFGFERAAVTVTPKGDGVRAVVPAGDACASASDTEGRIAARIRQAVPVVQSVHITVGASGRSLSEYVRQHCAGLGLPGGSGRVVITEQGSGLATTRSFTIHSRHWTVEYVNRGSFLQVLPMKSGAPTVGAFGVSRRGAGRRVVTGAGRFQLRVGGSGDWLVRVRDAA